MVRLAVALWICLNAGAAEATFDAAGAFVGKCSGCHSVGKGIVVGPDLLGVGERHDRAWLHRFIRSSQEVIRSGDPSARALFARYDKVMPDHDFAEAEIDQLLAFIAAGGPVEKPLLELRHARTASDAEVEHGRAIFLGEKPFAAGGAACVSCHVAGGSSWMGGGSLASDLTGCYSKLRDWGLGRLLHRLDSTPLTAAYAGKPLTAEEVFALKSFLYRTQEQGARERTLVHPVIFAGAGGAGLLSFFVRRGRRRAERRG